jgi:hypothetical protein
MITSATLKLIPGIVAIRSRMPRKGSITIDPGGQLLYWVGVLRAFGPGCGRSPTAALF